jgi:preprotein translocase subunit SecY
VTSDLARRALITLGALLVYRVGTYIPLPGIDPVVWSALFKAQGGTLTSFNIFAGGTVARIAIFALNLGPYLSAGILVQILSLFWSKLGTLRDGGDRGRRKIWKYTLGLTLFLAVFQSYAVASGLEGAPNVVTDPGLMFRISTVMTLTGGTFFLVWLSDLITRHGVGNGLALILFVPVVMQVPASIWGMLQLRQQGVFSDSALAGLAVFAAIFIGFIVFMELARRNVPIEYAERRLGDRLIEKRSSILSFKLNSAGIIPVFVAQWLSGLALLIVFSLGLKDVVPLAFGWHGEPGYILYIALSAIIFALLYVSLLMGPDDVAEKLKRFGGVVSGVAPGEATATYVDFVLSRTTILGGAYLALVFVIPEILIGYANLPIYLGGASALIIVCTVLDIQAQVRNHEFIISGRRQ